MSFKHVIHEDEIHDAVVELDALDGHDDPERDHSRVHDVLMSLAPADVYEAVRRFENRARW